MDGWGLGREDNSNAIYKANTPFIDGLYSSYPHAQLITCGEAVGLPQGQMGNSEVGHLNIGAGRVVYQELARINMEIRTGNLHNNAVLLQALHYAKEQNKPVHFLGLVSDGGVHSHVDHLIELVKITESKGVNAYIHGFTDGRDTDPKSGLGFVQHLLNGIKDTNGKLASLIGRYYAMDRDKRWERVKLAYDLIVHAKGQKHESPIEAIQSAYDQDLTDEFLPAMCMVDENNEAIATIKDGDVVLFFNFRTDRGRELTQVLSQMSIEEYAMTPLQLYFVTLTKYDETYNNVHVMFDKDDLVNTLGEVLANNGKSQVRAAETEKYPHVTFFFSGGREQAFAHESRILVPSPKVATYDLQPEMSARALTIDVLNKMDQNDDFFCINFANTDMVGHTGVFGAAMKAAETVDDCVRQIVAKGLELGYQLLITADHGNSDLIVNDDGSPNTAHTLNPVPLFWVSNNPNGTLENGKLGDLAPTILNLLQLTVPKEMTGNNLIKLDA